MGFLRPRADAIATLSLFELPDRVGGFVEWQGEDDLVPHLPAAYFDKILGNLATRRDAGSALLDRFEGFLAALVEHWHEDEGVLSGEVEILTEPKGTPFATVEARLLSNYEGQRLGAATTFKPAKASNEHVAEVGLWAYWDWTCLALSDLNDVRAILDNLLEQCAYYRDHGLPRIRGLGRAPFHGMMVGNATRLRNEIGALSGYSGEELMELDEEHRDMIISAHTRRQATMAQAASDSAFQEYTGALMERFDELWGSPHNPLMRETKDGPPGDLEHAIIKHLVRTTDESQVGWTLGGSFARVRVGCG